MSRAYVFLVHGIGKHSEGWSKPWQEQFAEELRRYRPFTPTRSARDKPLEDYVRFIEIGYDSVFEGYAARWGDLAGMLADTEVIDQPDLVHALRWVANHDQANDAPSRFIWDNILDAALWYSLPQARAAVVADVAGQLVRGLRELLDENGALDRAHCVGHSLGTSVLHDSLISLTLQRDLHEGVLDPAHFKWRSIAMVSNTSRLLKAFKPLSRMLGLEAYHPYRSWLRPGLSHSLTHTFFDVRHQLDPITWPRRFEPFGWDGNGFVPIRIEHFDSPARVHDFSHYLRHPAVHLQLLRSFVGNAGLGTSIEIQRVAKAYVEQFPRTLATPFPELRKLASPGDRRLSTQELVEYLFKAIEALR